MYILNILNIDLLINVLKPKRKIQKVILPLFIL